MRSVHLIHLLMALCVQQRLMSRCSLWRLSMALSTYLLSIRILSASYPSAWKQQSGSSSLTIHMPVISIPTSWRGLLLWYPTRRIHNPKLPEAVLRMIVLWAHKEPLLLFSQTKLAPLNMQN
ncbi:hypothetical protein BRADI_4g36928v3 [Brachypodium distachyon]|uniref:Uncharacterized protein n=1 Tax=Brachypodium distachyon TaxID=15368 RepID=A0A2K2CSR0_BRADI|nr:hypothetical protein BRADI_4g36928v3 [Brachypodium distachyon]